MSKPPRPRVHRYIAVPSSLFREVAEPLRTLYAGLLARAAAIYRVEEITVYREGGVSPRYLLDVLGYLRAPQYLRRRLYPRRRTLRYIGVAPPLATPNHPLAGEDVEYREGVVLYTRGGRSYVDAGLGKPVAVEGEEERGSLVVLRRVGEKWVLHRGEPPGYWCYRVSMADSLRDAIRMYRGRGSLVVATSRRGDDVRGLTGRLTGGASSRGSVALLYGLWSKGLYEVASEEGFSLEKAVDYVVNFIPGQGTRTVRTVEAVHASLAVLNVLVE